MKIETVKIGLVKPNPNNPRIIRDEKFKGLVKSIQDFPQMLQIRPIVVNDEMVVLGGNQRLRACKEAGLKEIPIIKASELTEEQQEEFIIKDNNTAGEWNWDDLANKWSEEKLKVWGMDLPIFAPDVDYSILDGEDLSAQLDEMAGGVKKAIQIEFEAEHYDEAYQLVKFWRERSAYVGGMIMEYLKSEKEKI